MTTSDGDDRQSSVDRDELVSAFLDGEATPAEVARVEADPVLQARLAALRRAAEAMAQPVRPAPAEAKEAAVARALAEADRVLPPAGQTAAGDDGGRDDLAAARQRREQRSRWLRTASIAAAIALVVAAIPLLARLGDQGGDEDVAAPASEESDSVSTVAPTVAEGATGDDSGGGAEEGEGQAPFSDDQGEAALSDLGSIDSEQELAERAAALLAGDVDSASDGGSEAAGEGEADPGTDRAVEDQAAARDCAAQLGIPFEAEAVASYQGERVAVVVAILPTGPVALAVDARCIVVARTEVEPR
jgi:hypothetical protein